MATLVKLTGQSVSDGATLCEHSEAEWFDAASSYAPIAYPKFTYSFHTNHMRGPLNSVYVKSKTHMPGGFRWPTSAIVASTVPDYDIGSINDFP
jgi:hypothetical protein